MNAPEKGPAISLEEILATEFEESAEGHPSNDWPCVTAEKVALLHLQDCAEQLARTAEEPIRIVQAAKSSHLALQAALTAALAGSMGIGAYPENERLAWLSYLQGDGEQPGEDKVMSFPGLLDKAVSAPLEWTGQPLCISPVDHDLLRKLTFLRHRMEHPRPSFWLVEPAYVHQVLPVAARITLELLTAHAHHFEEGDLDRARGNVVAICEGCERPAE